MNKKKGHVETRKHDDAGVASERKKMMVIYVPPRENKKYKNKIQACIKMYVTFVFCIKSVHVDDSFCVSSALTSRDSVTSKASCVA